jgi:hypothetical protein
MRTVKSKVSDGIKLRGDVIMYVKNSRTGKVITKYEIRNTIVYGGLNALIQLLAQNTGDPAASALQLTALNVGTGTTAPTRADTGLVAQVASISLVSANRIESLATSALTVSATLGSGVANGYTLTEAGLFLSNSTMYARQIHPAIPKTIAITIVYQWQLGFTS